MKSAEERVLEDYFSGLLHEQDAIAQADLDQGNGADSREDRGEDLRPLPVKPDTTKPSNKPTTKPNIAAKTQFAMPKAVVTVDERKTKLQKLLSAPIPIAPLVEQSPKNEGLGTVQKTKQDVEERAKPEVPAAEPFSDKQHSPPAIPESRDLPEADEPPQQALQRPSHALPLWAQEPFDVLMLDVGGLSLAVPLVCLGQIHTLSEELTPIFGRAEWFMGLLPKNTGKISVINTALYVMPERYSSEQLEHYKYIVTLDPSGAQPDAGPEAASVWGLAVDRVDQPRCLQPEEVNWRPVRSARPWLAGTVKSAMCALVDVPRLQTMLNENAKK